LANPEVGGSDQCLHVVQQGHDDLVRAVGNPGQHQRIADLFQLCDVRQLRHTRNVQMWLGDGVINLHVQENNPACQSPLCGIKQICDALLRETQQNNATNVEALAFVANLQVRACVDIRWDETIRFIADPVRGQQGGLRSWLWQTCTEVGYYQTCEANSTCPYARGYHLLDQDMEICRRAFGIRNPLQQVAANVQETIETYGGWRLQATRVLSVNGEVDPWSELALQKSSNTADRPVYHVPGASHHFWTNPVRPTDSKEVQEARAIIFDTLLRWLKDSRDANVEAVVAEER
jgi:thymus-specific serine protease